MKYGDGQTKPRRSWPRSVRLRMALHEAAERPGQTVVAGVQGHRLREVLVSGTHGRSGA